MQLVNRVKNNSALLASRKPQKRDIVLIAALAMVGIIAVFVARAAGTSSISGTAFYDLNRNGAKDLGEAPIANQSIYLIDQTGMRQVAVGWTDTNGKYILTGLSDATYQIWYGGQEWRALRNDWAPSTIDTIRPKVQVNLTGQATVDFGWRPIVRSSDINAPISSYTTPNGTKINSYNDVVNATDIYAELAKGSLFGKEAPLTTITFDFNNAPNVTFVGANGGPPWSNYSAHCRIAYDTWLENGDNLLFHEYGHAWSLYNAYIGAQNIDFTEYLKIRGITDDPRLDTGHAWSRRELIAEDFRQLFGSPNAQSYRQENWELPPAKDVPGLKEYLSGAFLQSTGDFQAPTPPGDLKATVVSNSQVRLSWTSSSDNVGVTKYQVTRYNIYGEHTYNNVSPSTTIFDDTGLSPDSTYNYYVTAFDATNNRSTSQIVTIKTSSPDSIAPSAPAGLTGKASTSEGSGITLTWSASTDNLAVDKYLIYRNGVQVSYVNSPSTTFADSGLSPNTNYQYYLKAVDAAGNVSAASTTITVNTGPPDIQAPTAPTGLVSPSQTNSSVSLKWNASSDNIGVVGYRVYRVGGTRKNAMNTLLMTTPSTNYTVTGLNKNSSYAFYIVAVDAAGNQSMPSGTLTVRTKR